MQIIQLLLLALPLAAGSCPWSICHTVEVHNVLQPAAGLDSEDGTDYRMLTAQQCQPSNSFPERCHVHETAHRPERVLNFTMRRAQLTVAPLSGLCLFTQLSGLDLAENSIGEFRYPSGQLGRQPDCLARLRWLSLRANDLRSVDISQFLHLPGLEQLDLSDNRHLEALYLGQWPPASSEPAALKTILASRCGIKQVDISLVRLPSLQDIDLSYNRVSRVTNRLNWAWTPAGVAKIAAERNARRARDPHYYARLSVQLVQNQIGPEAFADSRTLWGLPVPSLSSESIPTDAVVNALKLYRDAFQSFLYIDNTDSTITCDCRLLPAWAFLRRVHRDPDEFSRRNALTLAYWLRLRCDPTSFPDGGFISRRNITSLADTDLTCRHTENCPTGCACTERVMPSELTLDCRGAGLSILPRSLPASVHPVRYNLLLADNRIGSLDSAPPANASLVQRIDLSRNRISMATNFAPLAEFTGLHWLNLSGNPLLSLPPSLLNLAAAGPAPPRIDLGMAAIVHCECSQLEPEAWERVRRLLGDGVRGLRCFGTNGEPESPIEFRHRQCVQRPNATTSVVVREQQIVDQSVVLWAGIGSVLLFLLALVAAVFTVLRYRRSQMQQSKSPSPQPPPPSTMPQLMPPPPPQLIASGCLSPEFLPLGSPYDTMAQPRYAHAPASALFLLRGGTCGGCGAGVGVGVGVGGSADFRGLGRRRRADQNNDDDISDDFSSSDDSRGGDGGGDSGGFGVAGGSDPSMPGTRCPQHHDYWHGHGSGQRLRRGVPTRQMLERELLLPPPLPPRTQPPMPSRVFGASASVALATDV